MVGLSTDFRLAYDRLAFAESLGVHPDPWQQELLLTTSTRVLLNCSRQAGKSTMAALLGLHRAIYYPRSLTLMLAPALRQSQELFAKLTEFYTALGEPLKKFGERKLSLELTNGSRIIALPGTERTIRGYSGASLLIVDEAARVDDELYYTVRPMLAVSGGSLIMASTPYGRRGVFYQEWTSSRDWLRFEVPATSVPRISEAFLAEERIALPNRVFRQEYMSSFEDTEDTVFAHEDIEAMEDPAIQPLFKEAS